MEGRLRGTSLVSLVRFFSEHCVERRILSYLNRIN